MEKMRHPDKEEITQYVWEELPDEREIEIGEHLATCKECRRLSQEEFKTKILWENWTAKTHGEFYWQKRISEVLETALESALAPALKERIVGWLKEWRGKVGGAVEIILGGMKEAGRVVTELPQAILAPQAWQFAPVVVVRGEEKEEGQIKVISKEGPEVQIITDVANRKVIIQIQESEKKPPLVILSPDKGSPVVAEPRKVEGTRFYAASFENIPAGEYTLIFEPEEKD
jgi:hypothetical protein